MATRRKKTIEEIKRANLNLVLNRLKIKVAEKEEIWLDALEYLIPLCIPEGETCMHTHVSLAADLADSVLAVYEGRWGK